MLDQVSQPAAANGNPSLFDISVFIKAIQLQLIKSRYLEIKTKSVLENDKTF